MKYVWVKYKKGRTEDIVNQRTLDDLLAQDAIEHFYRHSEERWIILGIDRIRETEGQQYMGPERRNIESRQRVVS
jgi:hypothetical protein